MSDPFEKLVMVALPESSVAENFRTLRTNLVRHISTGVKKILIASAWAGEGKTLVTANIGLALSQIQKRVIILDGDMRRPKLSTLFGIADTPGFSNALTDENLSIKDCIRRTNVSGFEIVSAGTVPDPRPTDLMSTSRLATVLTDLLGLTDCLLVDSSPLALFSEGFILAGLVDGVILVVNPKRWRGEEEIQVKRQLETIGTNILGMVLNEVDQGTSSANDDYRYRYRYGKAKPV